MKLTKPLKNKILRNLLLKAAIKDKIIAGWNAFSLTQQKAVLQMLKTSEKAQNDLIKIAAAKNKNFIPELEKHVRQSGRKSIKRMETQERKKEEQDLDIILANWEEQ